MGWGVGVVQRERGRERGSRTSSLRKELRRGRTAFEKFLWRNCQQWKHK